MRGLMPDASEAELIEATDNLYEYLRVIYRITLRREAEERERKQAEAGSETTKPSDSTQSD